MHYTILKIWTTLDGAYHSSTVDKSNYDSAIGAFHSMFLPMQNDTNVAYFVLILLNEKGMMEAQCDWHRVVEDDAE